MQVAWGGYLSDEDTGLSNYYLYTSPYSLYYSDCAGYKSMSTLDEQSYLRCHCFHIDHHHHYITIRIHVYNNVVYDIWNNPVSFPIFFLDTFNMFPVYLLVVLCHNSHQVFRNL